MANHEIERHRYRRGYWMRLARRRSGLTLQAVAKLMDYSGRSASTFKLWEDGKRDPSDMQLLKMAAIYKVPPEVFFKPAATDEERLEELIRRSIGEANAADGADPERRVG